MYRTKEGNIDVDYTFEQMTEGEKQHMVNKIYKYDSIAPQQLMKYIRELKAEVALLRGGKAA